MEVKTPPLAETFNISNKPNKLLATKLNKVLNSSASEDAKIKAALSSLSDIPDLDEQHLRRNLRGTIEKKQIATNKKFLDAFEKVVKQFEGLQNQMTQMEGACKDMKEKLVSAESQTADMIEKADAMQEHRSACATRITIVDRFLEKFTLNENEIKILGYSSEPIDHAFFDALNHLQQIHSDCQLLLTTKNQTAGREIMEKMAVYQESAYEKLYKWTQYESRTSFGNDSIEVSSLMTKALRALMLRPVLFQTILDEIASARHDAVARAFINALTRGGPGGTPRPIELQAPDPLRYIGDMLAWVHQACAGEKEMLESLFQRNTDKENLTGITIQVSDTIDDLLDCAMDGTCRPLKSRMEQVLVLQPGAITSYKVANLIQFYTSTLNKLMRKRAGLERVLYEMTELAYKYFFKTLSAQADRLMQSAEPPNRNLSISPTVRDMTIQLKEILASYDSSLIVVTSNTEGSPEFDFAETLDAIIEPLVNMCELSTVLAPYPFTKQKRATLAERMTDLLNEIAQEEYDDLLKQAGLTKITEKLTNKDPNVPLSSLSNMDADSLSATMSKFDSFLVLIGADVSPQLEKLSSTQHCQQVQAGAIRLLLDTYRNISKEVYDPENGYEDPDSILPRTVEDMETIFSFAL